MNPTVVAMIHLTREFASRGDDFGQYMADFPEEAQQAIAEVAETEDGEEEEEEEEGFREFFEHDDQQQIYAFLAFAMSHALLNDDDDTYDALVDLANNPDMIDEVFSDLRKFAWVEAGKSRSGKPRWRNTETNRYRYQKSKPGNRDERRQKASATLAKESLEPIKSGTATAEQMSQLAENISALTKPELRQLKQELGAKFAINVTYRDNLVRQLQRYVQNPDNFRKPVDDVDSDTRDPKPSPQNPTNVVDKPTSVGDTTPEVRQVAKPKEEGGKMDVDDMKNSVAKIAAKYPQIASHANYYLGRAGNDSEAVKQAIEYLIHVGSDSGSNEAALEMQALAKKSGVKDPRLTHQQVRDIVSAAKASGVVVEGDFNQGKVYYKLKDAKTGNTVLEPIADQSDIQPAIERANKQMRERQKATRARIRGEQSS